MAKAIDLKTETNVFSGKKEIDKNFKTAGTSPTSTAQSARLSLSDG